MRKQMTLKRRTLLSGLGAAGLGASLGGLSACAPGPSKRFDAQTIVLGAGLSGLHTARLLIEAGQDVLVLEGSDRIGGRMFTADFGTDGLSECGGEQVGAGYARIRKTAGDVGLDIITQTHRPPETALHFGGSLLRAADWANAPQNPFTPPLRAMPPDSVLFGLAARRNPLESIYEWSNLADPKVAVADISTAEWLRAQNLPPEAIALIDKNLNANSVETYSMLNLFRTLALYTQEREMGPMGGVEGGAMRLPEAMAASLPRPVQTRQSIAAIRVDKTSAEAVTQDGKVWRAQNIVSTLPMPVLRNIRIEAPLSDVQKSAINAMPYTQILQIHFACDTPFWEIDGFGPSMSTDGPLERIFARQGKDGKPDGLFRSWINGAGASALNGLSDDAIAEVCKTEMAKLRPASKGDVRVLKIIRWTDSNPLAGGAYMHYAPGQAGNWAGNIGTPAGRLYFAGEHLSHLHTGMEGAMESAEMAAIALQSAGADL